MMSIHHLGQEHLTIQPLRVSVSQDSRVRQFPAKGVRDDDDDAFGRSIVGRVGDVAGEVVKGFHTAARLARVEGSGAAVSHLSAKARSRILQKGKTTQATTTAKAGAGFNDG